MKSSVIREMSTDEIRERIDSERNMLVKLKLNHAVSPLENPMKIGFARRVVARLLTELDQRMKKPESKSPITEDKNSEK